MFNDTDSMRKKILESSLKTMLLSASEELREKMLNDFVRDEVREIVTKKIGTAPDFIKTIRA